MNEPEISFSQLPQEEQTALIRFYNETTTKFFDLSQKAAWELAKFLFAANAGAAAGMFVMVRDSQGNSWLIWSYESFCAGVIFVGLAYFLGACGFAMIAEAWEADVEKVTKSELTHAALMRNQQNRVRGWKSKIVPICGLLSFLCLIIGGATAAKPLSSKVFYSNQVKLISPAAQSIAPKN